MIAYFCSTNKSWVCAIEQRAQAAGLKTYAKSATEVRATGNRETLRVFVAAEKATIGPGDDCGMEVRQGYTISLYDSAIEAMQCNLQY